MNISPTACATAPASPLSARAPAATGNDASASPEAGPDVVVTLGQSAAPAATYDAGGRFPGGSPAVAANDDSAAPDDGGTDDADPDATSSSDDSASAA